jgi:hypothetical protein
MSVVDKAKSIITMYCINCQGYMNFGVIFSGLFKFPSAAGVNVE